MASRQATVQSIAEAFNERDLDKMTAPTSDDFVYQLLPSMLKYLVLKKRVKSNMIESLERGPLDVTGFRELFEATKTFFYNFQFEVVDTFEDVAANKMIMWANVTSDTHVGKFATEAMHIFYFDEEGKIERWLEWVDSAAGKELERKMLGQ